MHKNHLSQIAKSYDKGIYCGRKGINLYDDMPETITSLPEYKIFKENENDLSHSRRKEIEEFLSPVKGMNFVDLGCCLNLMFRGYDKWTSTYHGVDISPKTIQLLNEYVNNNNISVGALNCCSIHETPFDDNYFDIGSCIGVLEYFERDFVSEAIAEMHRIIKPKGKLVLDIPDFNSSLFELTAMMEEHLGREDKFDMTKEEFEEIYITILI